MDNSIEFTAVWDPDANGWMIFINDELQYENLTSEEISNLASDLLMT